MPWERPKKWQKDQKKKKKKVCFNHKIIPGMKCLLFPKQSKKITKLEK